MKQARILRIFAFMALLTAVFWAVPGDTQVGVANQAEPNAAAGIILFQYAMNDGSGGTGTTYLSDDGTFVDNNGDAGVWSFNPANNRYTVYYNDGAQCGAYSVGMYNAGSNQIQGLRFCTDGSGAQGYWLGLLSAGVTTRVSVATDGVQGNDDSYVPDISADGRFVAFSSAATNLVGGDTNNEADIFVRDRLTRQTIRVSVASDGAQGNDQSIEAAISADGQYVAWRSSASNLVSGDTNGMEDIFVHDRSTGQTMRVSVASDGGQGNDDSYAVAISADGQYVAFWSFASNLVSGDTNDRADVFVHDRQTGETSRVSVASDGTEGNNTSRDPAISADGRYVAFSSGASNLVGDDTNGTVDIFVHDRQMGQTSRVSLANDGAEADEDSASPDISADGRYVAFHSLAGNLVREDTNGWDDVFVRDRQTGQTSRVSVSSDEEEGDDESLDPAMSADGRYVTFLSYARNLVSGDTNGKSDVFVYDRQTGQTTRVSVASDGTQANENSLVPIISADGRYVAFHSFASNLTGGDTNSRADVFVHDRGPGAPILTIPTMNSASP